MAEETVKTELCKGMRIIWCFVTEQKVRSHFTSPPGHIIEPLPVFEGEILELSKTKKAVFMKVFDGDGVSLQWFQVSDISVLDELEPKKEAKKEAKL